MYPQTLQEPIAEWEFQLAFGICWFPEWLSGKESICQYMRPRVQSLGGEDPLEEEMATHFSILAGVIPWTEEPGGLQSMGSQRVGYG